MNAQKVSISSTGTLESRVGRKPNRLVEKQHAIEVAVNDPGWTVLSHRRQRCLRQAGPHSDRERRPLAKQPPLYRSAVGGRPPRLP